MKITDVEVRTNERYEFVSITEQVKRAVRTSLFGQSQYLPLRGGALDLGRWQGVFLAEFDGPRSRIARVAVYPA